MAFEVYEVFRQKAAGEAHVHVGEVEAPNSEAAVILAKEHFVRREVCSSLWIVARSDIARSTWPPEVLSSGRLKTYRRSGGVRPSAQADA